jgi:hypothetical protein
MPRNPNLWHEIFKISSFQSLGIRVVVQKVIRLLTQVCFMGLCENSELHIRVFSNAKYLSMSTASSGLCHLSPSLGPIRRNLSILFMAFIVTKTALGAKYLCYK